MTCDAGAMDQAELESVEQQITALLGAWAAGSVVKGAAIALIGAKTGRRQWLTFGRQTAAWGAIDALIAGAGAWSRSRRGDLTDEEVAAEATKLRRLLLINAVADVLYVAGGAHIAFHAGPDGTSFRMTRGDGLAIVIQGAFLLALDATYAKRLHNPS